MKRTFILGVAAAAALATAVVAAPASAAPPPKLPTLDPSSGVTLATGLVTPLSLDLDRRGNTDLSQNFAGQLTRVAPDGTKTTLVTAPAGQEIGAVSTRGDLVYYAQNDQPNEVAGLYVRTQGGSTRQLADLAAYEKANNPDQVNSYGFRGLPRDCAAQIDPNGPAGPASYRGVVDSHPYASLAVRDGVYVADAGGNDILRVGYDGTVSTVAVLPAQPPVTVTAALATSFGLPSCVVGHRYAFEPVPTDVELGPDGWLYVTTLPGGPEDASLGARGSVYRIDPGDGTVRRWATGFTGATNLAVAQRSGAVIVTELFGGTGGTGQISVVSPRTHRAYQTVAVPAPAAIELRNGFAYGTISAVPPGGEGGPGGPPSVPPATGQLLKWAFTVPGGGPTADDAAASQQ